MEEGVTVLDGTLEDYEEMLDWSHRGILNFLREELRRVPLDGKGGQRYGDLLKNLTEESELHWKRSWAQSAGLFNTNLNSDLWQWQLRMWWRGRRSFRPGRCHCPK